MKFFDIVDKNDNVIGKRTVVECHSDPSLIHRVVHFTLVNRKEKKILISQRSFEVKFDSGMWCFMGEHVLSGETYESAVIKGVRDELGINSHDFAEVSHNIFSYDKQTEFVRFFLVDFNGEKIKPNHSEIIGFEWVSLEDLMENMNKYSTMTKYWVENVDWKRYL